MSRCFLFPPPNYVRNGLCGEALIKSMKLEMENAKKKAKKERKKEKRREKRAKRKELKVKEGTFSRTSTSNVIEFKLICDGTEFKLIELDRSDISEEHENAVAMVGPYSFDGTHNSCKRKRSTSPRSGHDDGALSKNAERDQCPGNSYSGHCEELQRPLDGAGPKTNMIEDERSRTLSVYNSLFQNWVPPPLACDGFKSMDEDWLLKSELQHETPVSKKAKHMPYSSPSPSLWPRAQYLPEAEIYALPYTVPF